jgi:hypothetical protein
MLSNQDPIVPKISDALTGDVESSQNYTSNRATYWHSAINSASELGHRVPDFKS